MRGGYGAGGALRRTLWTSRSISSDGAVRWRSPTSPGSPPASTSPCSRSPDRADPGASGRSSTPRRGGGRISADDALFLLEHGDLEPSARPRTPSAGGASPRATPPSSSTATSTTPTSASSSAPSAPSTASRGRGGLPAHPRGDLRAGGGGPGQGRDADHVPGRARSQADHHLLRGPALLGQGPLPHHPALPLPLRGAPHRPLLPPLHRGDPAPAQGGGTRIPSPEGAPRSSRSGSRRPSAPSRTAPGSGSRSWTRPTGRGCAPRPP